MLNVFPELLTYTIFAPTLIRLFLVCFFVYKGYERLYGATEENTKTFKKLGFPAPKAYVVIIGLIEIIAAVFLLVGAFTQVAALVLALWILTIIILKARNPNIVRANMDFYILLLVVTISLMLTGAGGFAIDLAI